MTLKFLRKKYPRFVYKKYSWRVSKNDLEIFFDFKIEPDISFKPALIIKNIDKKRLEFVGEGIVNNFVFHLGLAEIPSYWKATCSPEIIIEAGCLNKEQIAWWKKLLISGMGQYFYENRIDWRSPGFLTLKTAAQKAGTALLKTKLKNRYLAPMGGGRDSIVTLERLKEQRKEVNCFTVNPSISSKEVLEIAGIKNPVTVERKIDPLLLKLNGQGFLNGHTPFTAMLSFLAIFCGVLFDYKNIVFSNEKSSNEGNVEYLGRTINHQWSKSSEFEKMFKLYCRKYLAKNINYFSFLRKYTELEISKMFSKYSKYFPVFSSCNVALKKKNGKWCGKCPKCLFVYATLYPFLKKEELLKIFGKDLFEDSSLLPIMKDLLGKGMAKPFECVGTFKESKLAFSLGLKMAQKSSKLSYILTKIYKGSIK